MNPAENQADQRQRPKQAPKQEPSNSLMQNPYVGQSAANLITSDPIPNPYMSSPGKPQANLQYPPPYPVDSELIPNPYRKSGRPQNEPQQNNPLTPCPFCHARVHMLEKKVCGNALSAWALLLFFLGGIPCMLIPYCMDECYDKQFSCSACNSIRKIEPSPYQC